MDSASALNSGESERPRKTHCKRGHEFTPENTYIVPGRGTRQCRACRRKQQAPNKAERRFTTSLLAYERRAKAPWSPEYKAQIERALREREGIPLQDQDRLLIQGVVEDMGTLDAGLLPSGLDLICE